MTPERVTREETVYKKILMPVDESGAPAGVLAHLQALAGQLGAEVVPLRVITVIPSEEYFFRRLQVEEGSRAARLKAEAQEYLARLAGELRDQGLAATPAVVISDKTEPEAIVQYAEEQGCDLIVMPTLPQSAVGRWLFGSVGEKVRRRSRIPVLFVQGP